MFCVSQCTALTVITLHSCPRGGCVRQGSSSLCLPSLGAGVPATHKDSPPNTAQHCHGDPRDPKCRAGAREGWGVRDGMGWGGQEEEAGWFEEGRVGWRGLDRM